MRYERIEKNGKVYLEYREGGERLAAVDDALDMVGACFGADTLLLLVHSGALADDFYNLRTGLAGETLQKWNNYQIKAALFITDEEKIQGRFKELLSELASSRSIRPFNDKQEAEEWLLGQAT